MRQIRRLTVLAAILLCNGCTNTRYLTEKQSIDRQHDMQKNRTGVNIGDVLLSFVNLFISGALNSDYEISQSERSFKRIKIINASTDTIYVNMVTDVVWKENGYCDIMGVVLPPHSRQKLLTPYPAAYNVYFRSPFTDEEKLEIRNDGKTRKFFLRPGMTNIDLK